MRKESCSIALSLALIGVFSMVSTPSVLSEERCYNFNLTGSGWNFEGHVDWEWGFPSYEIDGKAWETNIGANYFNVSCGLLTSPSIDLGPQGGWLTFTTYNDVEPSYDGWNVQISTDFGVSWSMLTPLEGYDQGPVHNCFRSLGGDTNAGFGELEQWNCDLSGYANTSIKIRFWFGSDASVAYTGVVLDDVCIEGVRVPPHHRVLFGR